MKFAHIVPIALQSWRIVLPIIVLGLLLGVKSASATVAAIDFAAKVDFSVGMGPTSLGSGDMDGDGKPDLVTANHGFASNIGNSVSVLLNTTTSGDPTFAPKVDFTTPTGPHGLALGDIDGDNQLDIVTANYGALGGGNTISVLRNTSTVGSLSFGAYAPFTVNNGPLNVAIADLDGDGLADVAVANFNAGSGSTVSVLRNTSIPGSVSFDPALHVTIGLTGTGPFGIAAADLNGDGKPELAVANSGSISGIGTTVSVLRNTSTPGSFAFDAPVNLTTNNGPRKVAIQDLDGDGRPDIAVTNFGANNGTTISIFLNMSTGGNLSFASKLDQTVGTAPYGVASGDVDGDGRADIVVTNFGNYDGTTLSVLQNLSTVGNLAFASKMDFTTNRGPLDVRVVDLNANGFLDLAVSNYGSNTGDGTTVSVFRNTNVPTSATLLSFSATRNPKDFISIRWTTGTELNIVGFNVWRKRGDTGWRKLNTEVIPSKDLGGIGSNHYAYRDTQVQSRKMLRYQLEVLGPNGTLEWSEVAKVGAK